MNSANIFLVCSGLVVAVIVAVLVYEAVINRDKIIMPLAAIILVSVYLYAVKYIYESVAQIVN